MDTARSTDNTIREGVPLSVATTPVAEQPTTWRITKRVLVVVGLCLIAWVFTLGIHTSDYVRAYCQTDEPRQSPDVYVFMEPIHYSRGIPWVWSHFEDALPYPLEIAVTVDDRVPGEGVVIESLEAKFDNGQSVPVVKPDYPRGGPFGKFEPFESEKVRGRTFRRARIGIPAAIHQRGSFEMTIKGYIYGDQKQPFERRLRMSYRRDHSTYTGWQLWLGSGC
jgi:hypothetical protein